MSAERKRNRFLLLSALACLPMFFFPYLVPAYIWGLALWVYDSDHIDDFVNETLEEMK